MKTRYWPALAIVTSVLAFGGAAIAAVPAGEVLATKRRVVLERQDQQIPAAPAMALLEKDGVATDTRARAKLYFRDDSILNLGELSHVSVEEYLFNTQTDRSQAIYRLVEGTLKVVVGRSDLEIHTPTAVAAARGTAFIVTVRECTTQEAAGHDTKSNRCTVTTIVVLEGEVETRNIVDQVVGKVILSKGQTTRVFPSAAPEPAATIGIDALASLTNSLTVMGQLPGERLPGPAGGELARVGEQVTVKAVTGEKGPGSGADKVWRIASAPQGSKAQVADGAAPQPTFVPDLPGEYVLELVDAGGSGEVLTQAIVVTMDEGLPLPEISGFFEPPQTFLEEPEVLLDETQDVAVPIPTQEPLEAVTPVVIRIDLP